MIATITLSSSISTKAATVNGQAIVNEAMKHLGKNMYGAQKV